ncbi:alpha/beta fold hydrolase [Corallincola spongiicola]|uniref:Alpha/beta hydrolase n=1 Tax=Corallincola spongiicola TaxID=2520508 RepID=A0ABY1WUU5_9GAMM|nr:alpha/beta hydrolase [Corallincola spongiicola]TAA48277.1 alpha/beta hydrolase [Corallincola spongiicola]
MKHQIILIRGLLREQRHWETLPEILRNKLPHTAIITPDLAGNGRRHGEASACSISAMVEDLRRQTKRQRDQGATYLLAISMGGMIATEWAKRYPQELSGIALINTSFANFSNITQRLASRWYLPIIRHFMLSRSLQAKEALILQMTSNRHTTNQPLLQRWVAYHREAPVSLANALRQLLAAARYRAPRQKPEVPVILIASSHDQLVNTTCSKQIASQWQCPLYLHPYAGHDLPLDDPHWLAEVIKEKLQEKP